MRDASDRLLPSVRFAFTRTSCASGSLPQLSLRGYLVDSHAPRDLTGGPNVSRRSMTASADRYVLLLLFAHFPRGSHVSIEPLTPLSPLPLLIAVPDLRLDVSDEEGAAKTSVTACS
jgi:hypothetical protein